MPAKTRRVLWIAIIIAVIGLATAITVVTQNQRIAGVSDNLGAAHGQVASGELRAARQTLDQCAKDVPVGDTFWWGPGLRCQWAGARIQLSNVQQELRAAEDRRTAFCSDLRRRVADATEATKRGEVGRVPALFQKPDAKQNAPTAQEAKLLASLQRLAQRLAVQDFLGADTAIKDIKAVCMAIDQPALAGLADDLEVAVTGERKTNEARQGEIASQVRNTIGSGYARESGDFKPTLIGRAMVWDFTKNAVEKSYDLLPDDLRGAATDEHITIFCVTARDNIMRGRYSVSKEPAYQEKVTVAVVQWPEKAHLGTAIVWGGSPRSRRPVQYVPEYGTSVQIRDWIAGLPRR